MRDDSKAAVAPERTADVLLARLERVPLSRAQLRLAAILGAGTFFDAYDALAIATALTVIFTTLHIGFINAGLLIGTAYLGQFVGAFAGGALSELYGRKTIFALALLVFGLFSVGTALAWDFRSLLAFRVLQGLGLGAEIPIAGALFNEFLPGRRRGLLSISYQNMFGWGLLLTPLIGVGIFTLAGPQRGWRLALLFGALPILLAAVAWARLPESPRWLLGRDRVAEAERVIAGLERAAEREGKALGAPEVRVHAAAQRTSFGELFSARYRGRTALLWTMFGCTYFIAYGYSVWLPTLYVQIGGLPVRQSLLLTVIAGAVTVVNGYVFAALIDRVGRRPYFVGSFLVCALGAALGVAAVRGFGATGWPILFATTLIISIGNYPTNIGLYLYGSELFPTRMRGWAVGTGSGIQRLASAIAPYVVGLLLAGGGRAGIASVFALFLVVALLGLGVTAFLASETRGRILEELSA